MSKSKGKVYLVGAGPGDPGLITLNAVAALRRADVIIYDFLANARLLDFSKPGARAVYVGKRSDHKPVAQSEINALIIKEARRGSVVVRLKGGDPFIFGRGGEEALALRAKGILFEVVPGVSSATAVAAYAGIPLTHRDFASSVSFVTGSEDPVKGRSTIAWDKLSTGNGTLVFLMGWKNLSTIVKKLITNGRDPKTPVAVIRWGTMARQKTITGRLDNIVELSQKHSMKPPVITVVGDVVTLRRKMNWFEEMPLFGKTVLVTRASEDAARFAALLESSGAEPVSFPMIKTTPPPSYKELDTAIKRVARYDWIIFTSVNGVRYFFARIDKLGKDLRVLKGVKICAIGPKTAEAVGAFGIRVDLVPEEYRAEAVIKALGRRRIRGKRFLLPRALKAREVLPREIQRLGGRIDVAPAYRTVRPVKGAGELNRLLSERCIDVVTFTSSSTVTNFVKTVKRTELDRLLNGVKVACIGPITAETARGFGIVVDIMPADYTIEALAGEIARCFLETGRGK